MKTNYLLPSVCKKIGWYLFVPALVLGVGYLFFGGIDNCYLAGEAFALVGGHAETLYMTVVSNCWADELLLIALTVSMLFIGFSRERDEDECIASIRSNSLAWSVLVNSIMLIIGSLFVFEMPYLNFMVIFMFSVLLLFVVLYTVQLCKFRKTE